MKLAVADVEGDHAGGAALEQDVAEAARRGADVEAVPPGGIGPEGSERVRELDATPRDVRVARGDRELRGILNLLPGLRVPRHPPGEHERLRLGAAFREPALDQQHVDPFLHAPMIAAVAELQGERVRLRPLAAGDVDRLTEIGAEPEVARWWGEITREYLLDRAEGRDDATAFAIEHEGEVVGLAEFSEPGENEYKHANIDLFLTSPLHGRGPGTCPRTRSPVMSLPGPGTGLGAPRRQPGHDLLEHRRVRVDPRQPRLRAPGGLVGERARTLLAVREHVAVAVEDVVDDL